MTRKLLASLFVSVSLLNAAAFAQQTARSVGRMILAEPLAGGYLGVQAIEVTRDNFGKYNLREVRGVAVEKVLKDSPAAQAGIQTGDVIVSINGEEVSSVYKLTRLLNEIAPDHAAKITVLRADAEIELTATLGKREPVRFAGGFNQDDFPFPAVPDFQRVPMTPNGVQILPFPPMTANGDAFVFRSGAPTRQIGVNATALTKQLGEYFGVQSGEGILLSFVRENSPAEKAGLKAGDIITEADGKAVKTNADLMRALNDKKEGDVSLTIVRDKNRQTVRVTPEASKDAPAQFRYFGNPNEEEQKFLQDVMRQRGKIPPAAPNRK